MSAIILNIVILSWKTFLTKISLKLNYAKDLLDMTRWQDDKMTMCFIKDDENKIQEKAHLEKGN